VRARERERGDDDGSRVTTSGRGDAMKAEAADDATVEEPRHDGPRGRD